MMYDLMAATVERVELVEMGVKDLMVPGSMTESLAEKVCINLF